MAAQVEDEQREEQEAQRGYRAQGQQLLPPYEPEVASELEEAIELLDDESAELSSGASLQDAKSQGMQSATQEQDVVAASGVPAPEPRR